MQLVSSLLYIFWQRNFVLLKMVHFKFMSNYFEYKSTFQLVGHFNCKLHLFLSLKIYIIA